MKKHFKTYLTVFLILSAFQVNAQREANIWYFGRFLGLDFNSGTAVPLNDGVLNTTEGVATISDANGNLLFYTDGITIWNKNHQVMPNGTGLFGNASSTQSAVIVPKIGDPDRYYVFTIDQLAGPKGLCYSIVNKTLAGGLGDVELKNVALINNVTEKVTAVRHCNNRDVWVLTHGTVSDTYYAFLVSPTGVNTTPVISHTGSVLPGVVPPSTLDSSTLGYLKASPDGKKIAAAHWTVSADVSDFDNATGVVSNSYSLFNPGDPHYLVYGIEFSPDCKLVYTTVFFTDPATASKKNALYQYNVTLGTPAAVRASLQVISQSSDPLQVFAALQVAPDQKMYMAKNIYKHIACINDPNVYGPGCNFVTNAIQYTLTNQQSSFGLPTFVQSYFYPLDSFTHNASCLNLNVNFNYTPSANVVSVKWNFGDPASGANNTSMLNNPVHNFTVAGTYTVELVKFTNCGTDTLRKQITTDGLSLNLGPDTLICGGNSILLNSSATGTAYTFLWQDGSTNPTLLATASGLYWVEIRNASGCSKSDSINVSFKSIPTFNLGADQSICQNDTLTLIANTTATSFLWNNSATTSSIKAWQTGLYWCEANNGGCIFRDSITITAVKPLPVVNLGTDQDLCEGITTVLDASYPGSSYLWQNGSTASTFSVTQAGTYFVQLTLNGCKKSDTVIINYSLKPRFTLGADQLICPGNTIQLNPVLDPSWQLSWQDGSTGPGLLITQPGTYILTATNTCGSGSDQMTVSKGLCKVFVPNAFTPNNDGKNDLFRALGTETVTEFNLKVFDRAGQIVFQTSDKMKGWDGKMNGGMAFSSGIFVYMIYYKDINLTGPQLIKGTVTLIR